ncbi:undecaprenyl/decaprenyl-phosphate alpha-N-acetylglucosaminyl 1-phosphate transferase [Candidatus Peregrinibacteria bacterium]|nr:undecaprenyl/decaprenyl-phosphate alpha-N-acetylglucosaminyl 1-phosphate transferase [Candidatus Peregrinibacteria bacterium]
MMVLVPLLAFVVSVGLHWGALKLFPQWKLLDFPERYGLNRPRLPYPTGILSVLTFLFFFSAIAPWVAQTVGLVLGIAILAAFCFIDDRTPLPSSLRLALQVFVAILIFLTGTRIFSLTNPLEAWTGGEVIPLDRLAIVWPLFSNPSLVGAAFTIFWLGLTMNALNWFDGIPGQVSTLSLIGFLTIGFLAASDRVGQPDLALIAFLLAGVAAAALVFDFPPAKVLMGDTGSMFFGLLLGVLTIYSGGKVATAFLVLGVPLIDSALVVIRRLAKRESIFRGNTKDEHLHHRLLAKGWSPRQIIFLTAAIGTAFGVTALFLSTFEKFVAAILLFLVMLSLSLYSKPYRLPPTIRKV